MIALDARTNTKTPPSRRMFSIRMPSCSSPRPLTSYASPVFVTCSDGCVGARVCAVRACVPEFPCLQYICVGKFYLAEQNKDLRCFLIQHRVVCRSLDQCVVFLQTSTNKKKKKKKRFDFTKLWRFVFTKTKRKSKPSLPAIGLSLILIVIDKTGGSICDDGAKTNNFKTIRELRFPTKPSYCMQP